MATRISLWEFLASWREADRCSRVASSAVHARRLVNRTGFLDGKCHGALTGASEWADVHTPRRRCRPHPRDVQEGSSSKRARPGPEEVSVRPMEAVLHTPWWQWVIKTVKRWECSWEEADHGQVVRAVTDDARVDAEANRRLGSAVHWLPSTQVPMPKTSEQERTEVFERRRRVLHAHKHCRWECVRGSRRGSRHRGELVAGGDGGGMAAVAASASAGSVATAAAW